MNRLPTIVLTSIVLLIPLACRKGGSSPVVDDVGRDVRLTRPIRRVVTLAPNVTEIVACVGARAMIVGRDDFSDFPPEIRRIAAVGGLDPSVERIASLRPDLVIASAAADQNRLASVLSSIDIPLYFVRADRLEDIDDAARRIGRVLRAPDTERCAASIGAAALRERKVSEKAARILYVVWPEPLFVAGRETFVDDIIETAGGENAVSRSVKGWPQYSLEALVANPPDVILVPDEAFGKKKADDYFRANVPWRDLEAVKKGRVFSVSEDRFTRAGPRVGEAIVELENVIEKCCRR